MGAVPVHGEGLLHSAQRGHRARRRHALAARALRRHARRVQPPDDGERARQVRSLPAESRLRRHRQGHFVDRPVRLLTPAVRHHLRVQQCASQHIAGFLFCYSVALVSLHNCVLACASFLFSIDCVFRYSLFGCVSFATH